MMPSAVSDGPEDEAPTTEVELDRPESIPMVEAQEVPEAPAAPPPRPRVREGRPNLGMLKQLAGVSGAGSTILCHSPANARLDVTDDMDARLLEASALEAWSNRE